MMRFPDGEQVPGTMPCLAEKDRVSDADVLNEDGERNSTFRNIIKCIFLRKKSTEVVDMRKEAQATVAKKQTLTLDRSERSRRVLKMESMRDVPIQREKPVPQEETTNESKQRFLPSENPTTAFLSYLNPKDKSIRRAFSDAVRATSAPSSNRRKVREAFNETTTQPKTRNTNYRANRRETTDTDEQPGKPNRMKRHLEESGRPNGVSFNTSGGRAKRHHGNRKETFVPGSVSGYHLEEPRESEDEIHDLHDEMRRMNLSHPDLRMNWTPSNAGEKSRARNGLQLDTETIPKESAGLKSNGHTEDAIDSLYLQTQQNLDHIYQNGLERLESYRRETPSMEELLRPDKNSKKPRPKTPELSKGSAKGGSIPSMDNLLDEVSVFAKHRQEWLLNDPPPLPRYDSDTDIEDAESRSVNDRLSGSDTSAIHGVRKCNTSGWTDTTEDSKGFTRGAPATASMPARMTERNRSNRLSLHNRGAFTTGGPWSDNSDTDNQGNITYITWHEDKMGEGRVPGDKGNMGYSGNDSVTKEHKRDNDGDFYNDRQNRSILYPRTEHTPDTAQSHQGMSKQYGNGTNVDISDPIRIPHVNDFDQESETWDEPWGEVPSESNEFHDSGRINPSGTFRSHSPENWFSPCQTPTIDMANENDNFNRNDSFDTVSSFNGEHNFDNGRQKIRVKESRNVSNNKPFQLKPIIPRRSSDRLGTPMPRQSNQMLDTNSVSRSSKITPLGSMSEQTPVRYTFDASHNKFAINASKQNGVSNGLNQGPPMAMSKYASYENTASMRPFSEIPLRTTDPDYLQGNSRNNFLVGNSTRHDVTTNYAVTSGGQQPSQRPVSETFPPKRSDKIGIGHVLPTDSAKQRTQYARDIVNAMQNKPPNALNAFPAPTDNVPVSVTGQETNGYRNIFGIQHLLGARYSNRQPSFDSQVVENRSSHITTHGIDARGNTATDGIAPTGVHATAQRIKKLQRREQELEWLMKDAAETEV